MGPLTGVATGRSAVLLTEAVALGEAMRRDGGSVHVAADLCEALIGRRLRYAVRIPLNEFASPTRCRRTADLADGRGDATAASALRRSTDVAEAAAADVAVLPDDASPDEVLGVVEPALIAAWRGRNMDGAAAVDGRSPPAETLPHRALERATVEVDLVVTSHAALYEDLGGFGAGASNARPFSIAVIDEAERLVHQGARIRDLDVGTGALLRDVAALSRSVDADPGAGQAARDAACEATRLAGTLSATLAARVASLLPSEAKREVVRADPWLAVADALRSAVASVIRTAPPALDAELTERVSHGLRRLGEATDATLTDVNESRFDRVFLVVRIWNRDPSAAARTLRMVRQGGLSFRGALALERNVGVARAEVVAIAEPAWESGAWLCGQAARELGLRACELVQVDQLADRRLDLVLTRRLYEVGKRTIAVLDEASYAEVAGNSSIPRLVRDALAAAALFIVLLAFSRSADISTDSMAMARADLSANIWTLRAARQPFQFEAEGD